MIDLLKFVIGWAIIITMVIFAVSVLSYILGFTVPLIALVVIEVFRYFKGRQKLS